MWPSYLNIGLGLKAPGPGSYELLASNVLWNLAPIEYLNYVSLTSIGLYAPGPGAKVPYFWSFSLIAPIDYSRPSTARDGISY